MTPARELRRLSMSEAKRFPQGTRIRWARVRKQISHDVLAERVGSSRSYLIRIERGLHSPSPELLARIAVATEQPIDFLQNGESEDDEEDAELGRELVAVMRRAMHPKADPEPVA